MATVIYNPTENVTVTLSYDEILTLKSLVMEAIEHARIRMYPDYFQSGVDAVNAIVAAVYSDHTPLEIWRIKRAATDPLTRGDDLHQDDLARQYDPERGLARIAAAEPAIADLFK